MIFRWTDEATDLLRKHHADGLSFAQIAAEISRAVKHGAVSRNACIGRANRLGLVSANTKHLARKPAQPAPAPAPKPRKPRPNVAPHPFPPRAKPLAEQVAEIVFAPGPGGLRFMEQRDGYCRWPVSKATDFKRFRVCGCLCKLTQPYCDEHTAKAYQPRRPKPAQPARVNRPQISELFFKDWA